MRVLLVSHVAPPHIGGVENLVLAEANALLAAGHEVIWLTSNAGGAGQEPPEHGRLRIVRARAWHWLERRFRVAYPLFGPSLLWHAWREVARADVVHVHGLVFLPSVIAACSARLFGKWSVCTDHSGLLRFPSALATSGVRALFATLGRLTAHACDRLIAYNADVERLLLRLSGRRAKVLFVANPIDAALWRPPSPAERAAARQALGWDDRPRVLCVARLLPHKGIDVLLDAQDPAWATVFCGPSEDSMRAHIRAHGALCLPPRPQAELRTLYHAADAFALPSRNEGFPIAVQEALACGLPVLTSDAPAYAPYHGTPGLHFCPPTAAAVRDGLRALLATGRPPGHCEATPFGTGADAWVRDLLTPARLRVQRSGLAALAIVLVLVHVVLGAVRLPSKVWGKRLDDVAAYRRGVPEFLLDRVKPTGGADLAWLLRHAPAESVVLWRWPSDGALEFVPALLAPRLVVDERRVPPGAQEYAGRPLARGTRPDGSTGVLVVQGTPDQGLVLRVREP